MPIDSASKISSAMESRASSELITSVASKGGANSATTSGSILAAVVATFASPCLGLHGVRNDATMRERPPASVSPNILLATKGLKVAADIVPDSEPRSSNRAK